MVAGKKGRRILWIWFSISMILMGILGVTLYHLAAYKNNIMHIIKELQQIEEEPDTNQVLSLKIPQKLSGLLIKEINRLIQSIRNTMLSTKRLNQTFRQSITSISHDLRTPLTTAGGYIQLLKEEWEQLSQEEREEYIDLIEERQDTVRRLLEQLFEYARMEAGEITYQQEPVEVRSIFTDVLAMYYEDFCRKEQEPVVVLPEEKMMINGDENGIRRIFSNVIYNALVHGQGNYQFKVSIQENSYEFQFANDSVPLSKEDLENIFERFFTKDPSRTGKTTGLGLAIAKEITIRLQGTIYATYQNGQMAIIIRFPKMK